MTKYALINEKNIVIDLLEVENIDTLDGYVLPEHECALIYINDMEIVKLGEVWNPYTNKFE
jgi:hypothetical protein